MKKQLALLAALAIACGAPAGMTSLPSTGFTAEAQASKVSGVIRDAQGEPLIGATVKVKGTNRGTATDVDGKYSINANRGDVLVVSYVGSKPMEVTVGSGGVMDIDMTANDQVLDEVVVTALGIRKDKKSLGYAVDDLKAEELMRNKSANAINSLSGKCWCKHHPVVWCCRFWCPDYPAWWYVWSREPRQSAAVCCGWCYL